MSPKRFSTIGNEIGIGPDSAFSSPSPELESPFAQGPKSLPSAPGTQPAPMLTPMPSPGPSIPNEINRSPTGAEADAFDAAPVVTASDFDADTSSTAPVSSGVSQRAIPSDFDPTGTRTPMGITGPRMTSKEAYLHSLEAHAGDTQAAIDRHAGVFVDEFKKHPGRIAGSLIGDFLLAPSIFGSAVGSGTGAVVGDVLIDRNLQYLKSKSKIVNEESQPKNEADETFSEFLSRRKSQDFTQRQGDEPSTPEDIDRIKNAKSFIEGVFKKSESMSPIERELLLGHVYNAVDEVKNYSLIFGENAAASAFFNGAAKSLSWFLKDKAVSSGLSYKVLQSTAQDLKQMQSEKPTLFFDFQGARPTSEVAMEGKKEFEFIAKGGGGKELRSEAILHLQKQQTQMLKDADNLLEKIVPAEIINGSREGSFYLGRDPGQFPEKFLNYYRTEISKTRKVIESFVGDRELTKRESRNLLSIIKGHMDEMHMLKPNGDVIEGALTPAQQKLYVQYKNLLSRGAGGSAPVKSPPIFGLESPQWTTELEKDLGLEAEKKVTTINDFKDLLDLADTAIESTKEKVSGSLKMFRRELKDTYYELLHKNMLDAKKEGLPISMASYDKLMHLNSVHSIHSDEMEALVNAISGNPRNAEKYFDAIMNVGKERAGDVAQRVLGDGKKTVTIFDVFVNALPEAEQNNLRSIFMNRLKDAARENVAHDYATLKGAKKAIEALESTSPDQLEWMMGGKKNLKAFKDMLEYVDHYDNNLPASLHSSALIQQTQKTLHGAAMAATSRHVGLFKYKALIGLADFYSKMKYKNKALNDIFSSDQLVKAIFSAGQKEGAIAAPATKDAVRLNLLRRGALININQNMENK